MGKLKGFIVAAGHEAQVFQNHLDRMEENVCRCGRTPSEVGEEFVSSEDEGRMELSYASVREDKYVAPVRKLDLSHLCFSLNFYFPMFLSQFPSMFPFTNLSSIILFLIC